MGDPPEITILAPEEGAILDASELVVAVSFYDPDLDLDPDGVTFLVNGLDRTEEATVTAELLSWVPPKTVLPGVLEFEIRATDALTAQVGEYSAACKLYGSLAASLLELSGLGKTTVAHPECQRRGDERCVWRVEDGGR